MGTGSIEDRITTRLLRDEFPGIASVYLFGSEAEGRSHRESDIDLGVLVKRSVHATARDRFEQRLLLASRLANSLDGRPLDIVILNDAPPQLGRRIVTQGRRIFCSDSETDHAFVRDVQLRAADLEPFLRRMREIKLKALSRP